MAMGFPKKWKTDRFKREAPAPLKFGADGKFKILHITDTHLKLNHNFDPTIWMVEKACDKEKPDIVMLTGDIVFNCENAEDTKKTINALMNIFESSASRQGILIHVVERLFDMDITLKELLPSGQAGSPDGFFF